MSNIQSKLNIGQPVHNILPLQGGRQAITNEVSNSSRASNAIMHIVSQSNEVGKSLFDTWLIENPGLPFILEILGLDSIHSILVLRLVSKTLCEFIANLRINEVSILDQFVNKINFSFQVIKFFPSVERDFSSIKEKLEFCSKNGIYMALNIFGLIDIERLLQMKLELLNKELFSKIDTLNFLIMDSSEKSHIERLLNAISQDDKGCPFNLKKLVITDNDGIQLPSLTNLESLSLWNFNFTIAEHDTLQQVKALHLVTCEGDAQVLTLLPNLQSLSFKSPLVPDPLYEMALDANVKPFKEGMNRNQPIKVKSKICTLPNSLTNLKNLYIENIGNHYWESILELPKSFPKLIKFTIGKQASKIILPAMEFDNLESFSCESLSESIINCLQGSLETLINFSCGYIEVEDAHFISGLKNLTNLSIGIRLNTDIELPNLLTSLVELKVGRMYDQSYLKFPDALDSLTDLVIGRIHENAILEFPCSLNNLETLHIDNIFTKIKCKILNSDGETCEFLSLIPKLNKLKNLNISNKGKEFNYNYNSTSWEYDDKYDCEEYYNEYDDCIFYQRFKNTPRDHRLNLPTSLTNLTIQVVNDNFFLSTVDISNLTKLIIEEVKTNASLFFQSGVFMVQQSTFTNLTNLTIGVIQPDVVFQLRGPLNTLQSLTIQRIARNATLEIQIPLRELITLQIDSICCGPDDYEDFDDYERYEMSEGGYLKLIGPLPKLKHLIIEGKHIEPDKNGRFYMETYEDTINRLLTTINDNIHRPIMKRQTLTKFNVK